MPALHIKNISPNDLEEWNRSFAQSQPQAVLEWALDRFALRIALACSLSVEDTILLHMIAAIRKDTRVFVLDTGRLHEKTYETLENCRNRYGMSIEVYFPEAAKVEELVQKKGIFSFYRSVENRRECCLIRKVAPLRRALMGLDAWITGLRQEQSITRKRMQIFEFDENHSAANGKGSLVKINPLIQWTWKEVMDFAQKTKS